MAASASFVRRCETNWFIESTPLLLGAGGAAEPAPANKRRMNWAQKLECGENHVWKTEKQTDKLKI